jgi:predicted DsbA family dithiol-disulfide isomerase
MSDSNGSTHQPTEDWHLARSGEPAEPEARPDVEPGTIVIYSDISCAFAHLCVHRLWEARERLAKPVRFVHRPFILEEVNEFPIPKHFLDSEVPQIAPLDIEAGWRVWTELPETWPVSTLLAMEAVRAAETQGSAAHEQLDRALRLAFFRDHRCVSLRHVILEVAAGCSAVDVPSLARSLDEGSARGAIIADHRDGLRFVQGSPHLFFADGSAVHNPGMEVEWRGDQGEGYPDVTFADRDVHDELITRA